MSEEDHISHQIPDDPHTTHLMDQGRAAAREGFDLLLSAYREAKKTHEKDPEHAIFCAANTAHHQILERIAEKAMQHGGFVRGDTIIFNIIASAMYALEELEKATNND